MLRIYKMHTTLINNKSERITTGLLLAAGTGSRLFPLTKNAPKCLTLLNDVSILDRLIENLEKQGFKKLIIVTGYLNEHIEEYLGSKAGCISIEYVHNPIYKTTNNIYSLWMANSLIKEPFVLFESDLVFDVALLNDMMYPDRMAVSLMQPWLNGTTVTIGDDNEILAFQKGTEESYSEVRFKTVNIYSFSLSVWELIASKLEEYINNNDVNCYYETVFEALINDKELSLDAVFFDEKPWYEIDTIEDLKKAELLFPKELETSGVF